jgi:hypothetical protein
MRLKEPTPPLPLRVWIGMNHQLTSGGIFMRELRSCSTLPTGLILLAVLAVIFMPHTASAQIETSQPAAKSAQAAAQNPSAADFPPQLGWGAPTGEKMMVESLMEVRRIAAAVVAAANPAPKYVVQIGAHHGEFLEVFLDKFPTARGLWTEPNNSEPNLPAAKERLARFGGRVDYKFGCGERDISDGCVPKGPDVIITDWVSILQNLDGMYKIYRIAAEQLAPGGWFVNIDLAGFGGSAWEPWIQSARKEFRPEHEAPPIHHADYRTPTVDEQLGAMRAAGFDAKVVWQSFNLVLFMGHKK